MFPITVEFGNYRGVRPKRRVSIELGQQISFILGRNNCGKSSILRFFSECRRLFQWVSSRPEMDKSPWNGSFNLEISWDAIANRDGLDQPLDIEIKSRGAHWQFHLRPNGADPNTKEFAIHYNPVVQTSRDHLQQVVEILGKTMYCGPFRSTTFQGNQPMIFNYQTGQSFVGTWALWSGGENILQMMATEKLQHQIRDLFGFSRFSIRPNHNNTELQISYDDGTFKLSELGDSLSHFIVVLANALIHKPSFILIDEPENGLHPRLQSIFVQTLAEKASGLIATSHSVALARSVGDRIFYCTKTPDKGTQIVDFASADLGSMKHELLEMGYSQFQETGVHNLLLVEGRTDIKAYREILRKYGLDQEFVIISLGGGEFVTNDKEKIEDELGGLKALEPKSISVILDSERCSANDPIAPKLRTVGDVCARLGFNVFFTDRHSTENYVTTAALQKVVGPKAQALAPYENPSSRAPGWAKHQNWRLFAAMEPADFKGTGLDEFIRKTLAPLRA